MLSKVSFGVHEHKRLHKQVLLVVKKESNNYFFSSLIQIEKKLLCQSLVISFLHFHRRISFKFSLIFRIIIFHKFDTFPISLSLYSHARNTPSHLQTSRILLSIFHLYFTSILFMALVDERGKK